MKELIEAAEQHLLHVYNRYPVMLDYGEGMYLYDTNNKKYLDFAAGIGTNALGYGNEEFITAMKEQMNKLLHVSNYFYTKPNLSAVKALAEATGMEKVFISNSGAEAVEGAIKLARKYARKKGFSDKTELIAMNKGFHGRSMGAVSVTGTESYRTPFEPLIGSVHFAEFNDFSSVKELVSSKTCAVIVETVQGEGGIHVASEEFLSDIRKLCDEKDILMICDEVQCGMGRTGYCFAYKKYGIQPDVVTMAKGIGNGIAVGAFAVSKKAVMGLEAGDHGSTFGGNPFASAAITKVFEIFNKKDIVSHVKETGNYLAKSLDRLTEKKKIIKERRGLGLMQGIECHEPVGPYLREALKQGLILVGAGSDVIRFLPPLIAEKEHVDEMVGILDKVL